MAVSTSIKITINNEKVKEILDQVPKVIRGTFIENAILDFASRNPKIEFHFDGVTKTKRTRRTKAQMQEAKNNKTNTHEDTCKSINNDNKEDDKAGNKKNRVMFNFDKK
ncbi:hypothetical protein PQO74_000436 [Campylobacter lari]|uniref:hypothetical protein n=1 Tax=Campylobacter lari TaxID=201 RepID=UPI00126CCE60|nr:hypothetical protein [Campylobacter lari]EAK0799717.1 hypothetical protein [Campylobacter lari]EAL0061531.1 hypothetical protein [Campylobacter lari]EIV5071143.1 hypothetical protein [Campylobacter lari]EKL1317317.1 hypothetical protein [Campylobacter lari]MBT0826959.1 hypothetical protein [Campylobacter lari]